MPTWTFGRRFRPHKKRTTPFLLPIVVAVALCSVFFCLISIEVRPIMETVAVSRARNLISVLLSSSVDECLWESELRYSNFISIETDANGDVLSLTTHSAESSRMKRIVIERITERLNSISAEELCVPIGNLTGSIFLSGVGPEIRVELYSIGDVTAEFRNSFSAAGVNQTHHSLYLDLSISVYLLIPGEVIPVTVTEQVCIAETIIVGKVPDTYIHQEKGAE